MQVEQWLRDNRPDIEYHCPFLTAYPGQTRQTLETLVESLLPDPVYLMGSSLGGYWATWLVEKYKLRAVLINPAVKLDLLKSDEYVNVADVIARYQGSIVNVKDLLKKIFEAKLPERSCGCKDAVKQSILTPEDVLSAAKKDLLKLLTK